MKSNLIFLTEADLDKPVYRIFSFSRLIEIFNEKKLSLVKPKMWNDPFENFILSAEGKMKDGRPFGFAARHSFYGQCWSLTKESDAMWRIYSPNKDGVKVKSTIRKLFSPFFDFGGHDRNKEGDLYNLSSFVGKVKYSNTNELLKMLKDNKLMTNKLFDESGKGQASTFYYKRTAFKHENEVRLMYFNHNNTSADVLKFEINPFGIFDEIVFDPQMNDEIYKIFKAELIRLGYKKDIIQSGLYKISNFNININTP